MDLSPSGFSDLVVSVKRQLPAPSGFDLSVTAGRGFPTGAAKIAGRGYKPYIQFPWSRELAPGWAIEGMLTFVWSPSDAQQNVTFQPTLSLEREFGSSADLFVEYVGDYNHQPPAQLVDAGGVWRFTTTQQIDFHVGFGVNRSSRALNGVPVAQYFGIGYSLRLDGMLEVCLEIHHDLTVLAKTLAVALAVGLDVLAVSVGVGVAQLGREASLRLGLAFVSAEITMQVLGYGLGAGAGKVLGEIGAYAGFALLALVGVLMIRSSLQSAPDREFEATRGVGLLMTSLSISLDSLGVGVSLPGVPIPMLPLLILVSITTTAFTFIGLAFGARLGERYERGAERVAGMMLVVLAALFTLGRLMPSFNG